MLYKYIYIYSSLTHLLAISVLASMVRFWCCWNRLFLKQITLKMPKKHVNICTSVLHCTPSLKQNSHALYLDRIHLHYNCFSFSIFISFDIYTTKFLSHYYWLGPTGFMAWNHFTIFIRVGGWKKRHFIHAVCCVTATSCSNNGEMLAQTIGNIK